MARETDRQTELENFILLERERERERLELENFILQEREHCEVKSQSRHET